MIDRLSSRVDGDCVSVIYLYCNFQTQKSHAAAHLLASLLKQVVGGLEAIPVEISDAFQEAKQGFDGRGLSVSEILKLLAVALGSDKRTFICIDALDECATEYRPEFLRSLHSMVRDSPNVRLFATGRPYIQAELEKHHGRALRVILFSPVGEDIQRYLEMKLQDDSFCEAMDSELKRDIMQVIPERISEMYVDKAVLSSPSHKPLIVARFLLVSLNVKAVLRETTLRKRKEGLEQMTSGLGLAGAYKNTLERIQEQCEDQSKLAVQALMWISRSERLLRVDELGHALAVEIGSTHLDPDNVPSIQTILGCCLGLITVDKESSTVRLIHFTLQEYLRDH